MNSNAKTSETLWRDNISFSKPPKEWFAEKVLTGDRMILVSHLLPFSVALTGISVSGSFSGTIFILVSGSRGMALQEGMTWMCADRAPLLFDAKYPMEFEIDEHFEGSGILSLRGEKL